MSDKPSQGQLTSWSGRDGELLAWRLVSDVLHAEAATATAMWADLDGLHIAPVPAAMPTTARIWVWDSAAMWRVVPHVRPDQPPSARLARLTLGLAAQAAAGSGQEGVVRSSRTVGVHPVTHAVLPSEMQQRLAAAGFTGDAMVEQVDARLVIPLRFLALRSGR